MSTLTRPRILAITEAGAPVLLARTRDLSGGEIASPEVQELIDDMIATCEHAGGLGLAAPQVGQSVSLFVFKPAENRGEASGVALKAAINPRLVEQGGEDTDWEGCLSIPGYRGLVTRPARIGVEYLGRDARPVRESLANLAARVFQHEHDHLHGVLYTMKPEHDRRSFCTNAQWARMQAGG